MKDGFVRCASATVDIKVADTDYNTSNIIKAIEDAAQNNIKLIVFPELCITGYTCGDLFLQKILIDSAKDSLIKIAKATENLDITAVVGLPYVAEQTLYNCAAVVNGGHIKGLVPKLNIPNYAEFYEVRHFTAGKNEVTYVNITVKKYRSVQIYYLKQMRVKILFLRLKFARICGRLCRRRSTTHLQVQRL